MQLTQGEIAQWIEALATDPSATVEAKPPQGARRFKRPATWRLGVIASAYFYIPCPEDVQRLADGVPEAFASFDALTGKSMAYFYAPKSANISPRAGPRWPDWPRHFRSNSDDMAVLHVMDQQTKEASPGFAFDSLCSFAPSSQPGGKLQSLSHLKVTVPLPFLRTHGQAFDRWWFQTMDMLRPEQAYLSLAFSNPSQLERYPLIEPAEFALAKAFHGLDVDKPAFMCASPRAQGKHYLEHGMRTPTFGVFVSPKYLPTVGGEAALREAIGDDPRIRIAPIAGGFWLQAGEEPALHPVSEGIPSHVARIAQALRPARLDALWLLSFVPLMPQPDRFGHEDTRRWLRRFDADGDWPSAGQRFDQQAS